MQATVDALAAMSREIDANPTDRDRVVVLADWFEDQGNELGQGLRWLLEKGYTPEPVMRREDRDQSLLFPDWKWSGDKYPANSPYALYSGGLPYVIFRRLPLFHYDRLSEAWLAGAKAVCEQVVFN